MWTSSLDVVNGFSVKVFSMQHCIVPAMLLFVLLGVFDILADRPLTQR
jgi:hypothetical protein